jgi:hypothetical protein
MAGIEIHREPEDIHRQYAPCAAAMTFDVGDPVRIVTNQLADCLDVTADELLVNGIVGFACEPAEGITAGSRATNAADGFGVVTEQMRSYWPFDAPGLELRTRNFWVAGGVVDTEKDGTEIGDLFVMKGETGTNRWGLDNEAPTITAGTITATDDAAFLCIAILDNDMQPIGGLDTQTAGDGWIVFRPVGPSQIQFGGV